MRLLLLALLVAAADAARESGRCTMRGTCGSKGLFGAPIPCPDNGLAVEATDPLFLATLSSVCGSDFSTRTCCTQGQLDVLSSSLAQAEALTATCPACHNNFRHFFCQLSCSPDQSLFMEVTSTQNLTSGGETKTAVKSVEFLVGAFAEGFYDSCKDVKFGATNGRAMDLLGGGAGTALQFLQFLGQERALGSPFQIDFSDTPRNDSSVPFNDPPLSCSSSAIDARCPCPDCPAVCAVLPPIDSPSDISAHKCTVGRMSCGSFALVVLYAIALVGFVVGVGIQERTKQRSRWQWESREASGYDRLAMDDPHGMDQSPRVTPTHSLVGATSTSNAYDGEDAPGSSTSPLDPSDAPFLQPRSYPLNTLLSNGFYRLGLACAQHPFATLSIALALCGLANTGLHNFQVEKDPVKLWVGKGSESEVAKSEFDASFGPFYRTEQIFVSVAAPSHLDDLETLDSTQDSTPVLNWERLQWWADVEAQIRTLRSPSNYTLADVCFSPQTDPLPPTSPLACVVQSIMGYFGDSLEDTTESNWRSTLNGCAASPASCLPGSGMPTNPKLVLGGIPTGDAPADARALVITYVVRASLDAAVVSRAEEWETTLQAFLVDLAGGAGALGLDLAYSTGISLEEELSNATNSDLPIVALSYLLMFLYVSTNLGSSRELIRGLGALVRTIPLPSRFRRQAISLSHQPSFETTTTFKRQIIVDSKFLLGLWGIIIVLLSVSTSVALFSALGIKVTLVIAQVIPFLVLAIGIDNIFILSHELDQQSLRAYTIAGRHGPPSNDDETLDEVPSAEERVARALARMGPSILLSASCETVAFGLGALVGMPAVRNFAIYAAGAVVVNTLLQVTVFVSAMALDLRRVESNRIDCFPCIKIPAAARVDLGATVAEGYVARFIRTTYAPILLKKYVKYAVLAIFGGVFTLSWIGARHIELGLDQRLALPRDSYLVDYFNALDTYLDVGPPVYFVAAGINVTTRANQQQLCGRFSTCDELSLANVLEAERKRSDSSFLAEPPAVWMDDFFQWLNPLLEDCCRVKKRSPTEFCDADDPGFACRPCLEDAEPAWNITMEGLPQGDDFMRYLDQWLVSPTDESCPLGGKASYASALALSDGGVSSSHFRTYHTPLKTQADFINAFAAAQRIAADLSVRTGARVYPYSLFYVFFDQYSHIIATTREVLSLALLSIFGITSALLGSWRTGGVVALTVALTVMSVMGIMGLWGISLNAISLVNLVISVGISVEFCSHVARAFMGAVGGGVPFDHPNAPKDRDARARAALIDVGSSVICGITLTKLIGMSVLAFTSSQLLEVYFFRMWLALIISGAAHGLVFLPVALSFFGGQGFSLSPEDQDWIGSTLLEHESRPFLESDDDSVDSLRF